MTHRDEDEEIIDTALDTLAWQRREIDRLTKALQEIAEPCAVTVEPSGKAGEGWKKMYYAWRKIAVDRVDIARNALRGEQ